jgi:hypothetical protein
MSDKPASKLVMINADMKRYGRQYHRLNLIAEELVKFVNDKDIQYGSSWRKRGGAGAFMVIARKWDRIEQACETRHPAKYDIFDVFEADGRNETILDDCLDLVGYLLILVEHMIEIGHVTRIKELNMSFPPLALTDETEPSGMKHPFGFDEGEDSDPPYPTYHPDQIDDPRLPKSKPEDDNFDDDALTEARIDAQAEAIPGPEGEE